MSEPSTAPGTRTGAPRKRVNRREEILRAATEIFVAQGFHNASLADIAATLGITPAGILHHFGSKTELLTAVLELRDKTAPPPSGERFLDHLVDTVERNAGRPGTTQLYAVLSAESATAGHPAQEWFRERYEVLRDDVEEALLDRLRSMSAGTGESGGDTGETTDASAGPGEQHPQEVRDAAAAVIAVMDGLQVQWLLDPESVDMAAVTRLVLDAVTARLTT